MAGSSLLFLLGAAALVVGMVILRRKEYLTDGQMLVLVAGGILLFSVAGLVIAYFAS